jgi:hypothetical protein
MTIVVRCDCGATLKFRDDALGKRGRCTQCQAVVEVRPERRPREEAVDQEAGAAGRTDGGAAVRSRRPAKRAAGAEAVVDEPVSFAGRADVRSVLGVRLGVRVALLIVMLLPILLATPRPLSERLIACFVPLLLTGTFRTSRIRGERFISRFHFAFVPVVSRRCHLRGVSYISAKYGYEGSGLGTFILFGPMQVILGRVFDFLMPSIGGPYQIHLITAKGRELVAWQGYDEPQFRKMLDLLMRMTKAELRPM